MDYVNKKRAGYGAAAFDFYRVAREYPESQDTLTELLHDLMHFATREGYAWTTCAGQAHGLWSREVKPRRQGVSHSIDETNLRIASRRARPWWRRFPWLN